MHTRMRVVPRYPVKSPSDFLTSGFRPFFLGAGIVAVVDMALWLAAYSGMGVIPTFYPATAWHAREMLFGYGAAAIAGFLLTAVAAWTEKWTLALCVNILSQHKAMIRNIGIKHSDLWRLGKLNHE